MTTDERFEALEKTLETSVRRQRITITALILMAVAVAFLLCGGRLNIVNKTDETVVQLKAEEYGNGFVGAFDRHVKGRTLQPGN
jgi:hypothetical protein